jgi:hypothetical protein
MIGKMVGLGLAVSKLLIHATLKLWMPATVELATYILFGWIFHLAAPKRAITLRECSATEPLRSSGQMPMRSETQKLVPTLERALMSAFFRPLHAAGDIAASKGRDIKTHPRFQWGFRSRGLYSPTYGSL